MSEESIRLAISIKNQCTDKETVDKTTIYKLKLESASTSKTMGTFSTIRKFSFGEPNRLKEKKRKTILLMGESGSGKTTWINAMINYVLDVQLDDDFRFVLADDVVDAQGSKLHCQGVTSYNIHHQEGSPIPFPLTIIDTPGFGDTAGLDRDKIILAITKFFHFQNGIKELNAVAFVVQSSLARLNQSQIYSLNYLVETFGKDIEKNIIFLTTLADGGIPQILSSIQKSKVSCRKDSDGCPCYKSFSNGSLFKSPQSLNVNQLRLQLEWTERIDNFRSLFDDLSRMEPLTSLKMRDNCFKQLGESLDQLQKVTIPQMNQAMKDLQVKLSVSKTMRGPVVSSVKNNLNCTKCQRTCHYPCDPNFPTGWCEVFSASQDQSYFNKLMERAMNTFSLWIRCSVCKCGRDEHIYEESGWIYKPQVLNNRPISIKRRKQLDRKPLNAQELAAALQVVADPLLYS